jgi:hypothetical protein
MPRLLAPRGAPIVLRVGLIVASVHTVARTVSIAIHFWNVIAIRPKQQLLPHFRKARAAILAVEVVEKSGHAIRTPLFDHRREHPTYHVFCSARSDLVHNPTMGPAAGW